MLIVNHDFFFWFYTALTEKLEGDCEKLGEKNMANKPASGKEKRSKEAEETHVVVLCIHTRYYN